MVDFPVAAAKTALINVDMQKRFVEGYDISAPEGLQVLERLNRLSAICREQGILVIHTAQEYRPDLSNMGIIKEVIPAALEAPLAAGSEAAKLHPNLTLPQLASQTTSQSCVYELN